MMQIELHAIPIRELVDGFVDNDEEGVVGYHGLLNIRPKYQREFIYNEKEQAAVVKTVMAGLPLNVMYWSCNDDGTYEIIDGQQRTMSICKYYNGDFATDYRFFANLTEPEQQKFLDYHLMVYFCTGNDEEKLEWFQTINIAGKVFTQQELRNAVYAGPWLTDAKKFFSKSNCAATRYKDYMKGTPIRQQYLEEVLKWISNNQIETYMAIHQHDENADELKFYFRDVMEWVEKTFKVYRKEMKGLPWGEFYNQYKDLDLDPDLIENRVEYLMMDDEITNKKGIYRYMLSGDEKYLNLRKFSNKIKREVYERQNGICAICGQHFNIEETEADHIIPWSEGGRTVIENCQLLCKSCNRRKGKK